MRIDMQVLNMNMVSAIAIQELYDAVANKAIADGLIEVGDYKYDCTKIEVSNSIADLVENYYKQAYPSDWKTAFGMSWLCFGPKVNDELSGMDVEVTDGFFVKEV